LTHFCSSGRGVRALTVAELATIVFGIPSQFVPFFDFYHLQCLPINVFDALFLAWSKATLLPTRKIQKVEYYFFTPATVLEDSTPLFIQSIQKHCLSLGRVFSYSSNKATKADDALVQESMWNNLIMMIWSRTHLLAPVLRALILR